MASRQKSYTGDEKKKRKKALLILISLGHEKKRSKANKK